MIRKLNTGASVFAAVVVAAGLMLAHRLPGAAQTVVRPPEPELALSDKTPAAKTETAVFAGGCFWGIQSVFQHMKGVISATSGYAGGSKANPTYEEVSTGRTGHAEAVRVVFDPSKITYEKLLTVFFSVAHDPTQLNRQGPDHGTQYRSALFYTSDDQKKATEAYIKQLDAAQTYMTRIVTQVVPLTEFYAAEAYHQGYAEAHPTQPYIVINDAPKVANLKKLFPELYTDKLAAN